MEPNPRRRLAAVLVDGLGPVGARTALALAEAGVGTLLLRDGTQGSAVQQSSTAQTVDAEQVGDPYLSIHHGLPRSTGLQDLLDRAAQQPASQPAPQQTAVMECPADMRPDGADVCVLSLGESSGAGPAGTRSASRTSALHAATVSAAAQQASLVMPVLCPAAGEAEIGPLIAQPGVLEGFACAGCRELSAVATDIQPAPAGTSVEHTAGHNPADARLHHQLTAGLITRQLLTLLDGVRNPALAEHSLLLRPDGGWERRPAPVHPECACQLVSPEPLPS